MPYPYYREKPSSFSEEEALVVSQQPAEVLDELLWDTGLLETYGTGHYTLHQTVVDYARALSEDPADQEFLNDCAERVHRHEPGQADFDGSDFSYPADQLPHPGQVTLNGQLYLFPAIASGVNDNVIALGQTISIPSGHYQQAFLLVAGSWGLVSLATRIPAVLTLILWLIALTFFRDNSAFYLIKGNFFEAIPSEKEKGRNPPNCLE